MPEASRAQAAAKDDVQKRNGGNFCDEEEKSHLWPAVVRACGGVDGADAVSGEGDKGGGR